MYSVLEVNDNNKEFVISWLKNDVIRNAFAIYDLQYEQYFTKMYIALDENGRIDGYMLVYTKLRYPSVILEGNHKTAKILLEKLQIKRMIMPDIPQDHAKIVKEIFPNAKFYVEDRMLIKRNQLRSIGRCCLAKRLKVDDVYQLIILMEDVTEQSVAMYTNIIQEFAVYGVFIDEKVVSSARAFVQLPEVWIIGGVYTRPEHRNKGLATQVTYALTKEVLERANSASLFVRSDNYPAIRVYTKIGYEKIEERIWVDIGTGIKP